jgi:glycine dehydrogenase subunit 2
VAGIVHAKGGLVYGDGANMNAVMGIVDIQKLGVDVLHLNLHKTFSTPHGGGGPGSGPICVTETLAPFLPVPRVIQKDGRYALSEDFPQSVGKIHAFYGNFGVLVKAYSYILSLGADLEKVSQYAVLNANYIKESLKDVYHLAYDRACMHECVFNDKHQEADHVTTLDIAKRLMEYGFHPPTVYFPLVMQGAIMVEPTETESKEMIDAFIDTMRAIAEEVKADPEQFHEAPRITKVRRLDETGAARNPCLKG